MSPYRLLGWQESPAGVPVSSGSHFNHLGAGSYIYTGIPGRSLCKAQYYYLSKNNPIITSPIYDPVINWPVNDPVITWQINDTVITEK